MKFILDNFKETKIFPYCLLICCLVVQNTAYIVDNNPYRHFETLDRDGNYNLEWLVDFEQERVYFNVSVKTKGYVGFGLSKKGKMSGSDIVIGGVTANGDHYFSDRFAIGNQIPKEDESQDWTLHSASETATHTKLSFSRPFDTCDDDHDIPISGDLISLIWAYGEVDDKIQYHFENRGRFDAYLLDPDLTPRIIQSEYRTKNPKALGRTKVWTIRGEQTLPAKHTAYICSLHKSPRSPNKRHMIGFQTVLRTPLDRKHIHHYSLLRCHVPEGQDPVELFQRDVDNGTKQECYVQSQPSGPIRTNLCQEVVYIWEPNGRPFFLPEHVGFPLNENGPDEYYMLQMHFDNQESLAEIHVTYELEIFHTDEVREHDGACMQVRASTPGAPSLLIPPNSIDYLAYGHCSAGCTNKMVPPEGIHMFAVNLHTHLAGRGLRLLHIRDGSELPWISYDDNYNFDFQQIRNLREERTVIPGDQLIIRCTYENTDTNGTVTTGGFGTRDEMCLAFVFYYNRLPNHSICRSEIKSETYRRFIGIYNTTWSNAEVQNVITDPRQAAGLTVKEYGNMIDWTIEKRRQIQEYHRVLAQITECPPNLNEGSTQDFNSWSIRNQVDRARVQSPLLTLAERNNDVSRIRNFRYEELEDKARVSEALNEIQNPDWEFVSVYPKNIVPYERPRKCHRKIF